MADFGAQLQAWANKTGDKLEDADRKFKFELFGAVVRRTRVADPSSWKRPDPNYLGGTMRGNWQITTGGPAVNFIDGKRNTGLMPASEAAKIEPFSATWLANNTPYVRVYEEQDAMVASAIADAMRLLENAVK